MEKEKSEEKSNEKEIWDIQEFLFINFFVDFQGTTQPAIYVRVIW